MTSNLYDRSFLLIFFYLGLPFLKREFPSVQLTEVLLSECVCWLCNSVMQRLLRPMTTNRYFAHTLWEKKHVWRLMSFSMTLVCNSVWWLFLNLCNDLWDNIKLNVWGKIIICACMLSSVSWLCVVIFSNFVLLRKQCHEKSEPTRFLYVQCSH